MRDGVFAGLVGAFFLLFGTPAPLSAQDDSVPDHIGEMQGSDVVKIIVTEKVHHQLVDLWDEAERQEREKLACLDADVEEIPSDTMLIWTINRIKQVKVKSDKGAISHSTSLSECEPPEFVGTVHTHLADSIPNPSGSGYLQGPFKKFSPGDYAAQDAWANVWEDKAQEAGMRWSLWCIMFSDEGMNCIARPFLQDREDVRTRAQNTTP